MKELQDQLTAADRMVHEHIMRTERYIYEDYVQQMLLCMPYLVKRSEASRIKCNTDVERQVQREFIEHCNAQILIILNIARP